LLRVRRRAGDLLLVLCLTMAGAVLGASYAVFLVRERESASKAVQLVAGAPPTAFWGAALAWDLAAFCVPAAGANPNPYSRLASVDSPAGLLARWFQCAGALLLAGT